MDRPVSRPHNLAGLGLVAIAVTAGWWWGSREPQPLPDPTASPWPAPSLDARTITVHVAGWVARPGLVELPEGARWADAVAAAGGLLPGAAGEAVNLAAPLVDGEQVSVPGPDAAPEPGSSPAADGKVHLNQATASELDALPGVGPVIAERIVAYRAENGPFQTVEDLLDVPGIGEAKLANLRALVLVP